MSRHSGLLPAWADARPTLRFRPRSTPLPSRSRRDREAPPRGRQKRVCPSSRRHSVASRPLPACFASAKLVICKKDAKSRRRLPAFLRSNYSFSKKFFPLRKKTFEEQKNPASPCIAGHSPTSIPPVPVSSRARKGIQPDKTRIANEGRMTKKFPLRRQVLQA